MTPKFFIAISIIAVAAVSCNKNDIEDLEKRLDRLEDAIGSNEPIKLEFATTDYDDNQVSSTGLFAIKSLSGYTHYIVDYGDGTYYIYVERLRDVEWDEYAYFNFYYDSDTEEISNLRAGLRYLDPLHYWQYPYFTYSDPETTLTANLKNLNLETGALDIEITGETTDQSGYNQFEGHSMSVSMSFKGKLKYSSGGD